MVSTRMGGVIKLLGVVQRLLAVVPCSEWSAMLGASAMISFPDREVGGCR